MENNLIKKGINEFNNGLYSEAIKSMTTVIEINPFLILNITYRIRGISLYYLNNYEAAFKDLKIIEKQISQNSEYEDRKSNAQVYYFLGLIQENFNNQNQAKNYYLKSLMQDSNNKLSLFNLLDILKIEKDFDRALEILEKNVNTFSKFDYYLEKGEILENLSKSSNDNKAFGASIAYGMAINENPNDFRGYQGSGNLALKAMDYNLAIKDFSKCIELKNFTLHYYLRAICYKKLGKTSQYIKDIKYSAQKGNLKAKQEIKDNEKLFYEKKILFFDTETTGTPKDWEASYVNTNNWPRLVQLAWELYDESGKLIESNSVIIKPDNFVIPNVASNVHGITTEIAYLQGEDLELVLEDFKNKLCKSDLLVAHNMSFDEKILGAEFYRLHNINPLLKIEKLCTMRSSTNICKIKGTYGYKWPKLKELYNFLFKKDFENAHDAKHDIRATAKCYFELKKRALI